MREKSMTRGSLTIVGTGIQLGQMTLEAASHIKEADKVFYLVTDPVTSDWIGKNNVTSESLESSYDKDKDRLTTYLEMVERILEPVRKGLDVCVAFYGHPGVFVLPSHLSIKRARDEGHRAKMLPGVSAEDCMFCDLGFDPATFGCQSFEATDFLVHHREFDACSSLVIWQIGVIGDIGYKEKYTLDALGFLIERLLQRYPADKECYVYEAARYVICDPTIQKTTVEKIANAHITPISTLYIPPAVRSAPDLELVRSLGIPPSYVRDKQQYQDMKLEVGALHPHLAPQ
jgi:uncharacterized protein YabN with tetrapyrrole methylase and pyrophosphatase domain